MFRDKRALGQECIDVCHESFDDHGKPEQMDASMKKWHGRSMHRSAVQD
jgi:hypothetical protein